MRSYTNLLLLSGVFENLSEDIPLMVSLADRVFNPTIKIVEADCGTQLGKVVSTAYEAEGRIEIRTGNVITASRVNELLSRGIYKLGTRSSYTCISRGGVCLSCYLGRQAVKDKDSNEPDTANVGDVVKLQPDSRAPFLNYMAKTYSGSLMGIKELPSENLPIRPSLYQDIINETEVEELASEVFQRELIPEAYVEYWSEIIDPLEKTLYLIAIYRMFYQT